MLTRAYVNVGGFFSQSMMKRFYLNDAHFTPGRELVTDKRLYRIISAEHETYISIVPQIWPKDQGSVELETDTGCIAGNTNSNLYPSKGYSIE